MNILVSALGTQPVIIEETIAFFNPAVPDFYANSPVFPQITADRKGVERVDEVWLVTTDQQAVEKQTADGKIRTVPSTREHFTTIKRDCARYGAKIRLFLLRRVADITGKAEAEYFHDLALQVVFWARKRTEGGKLYLSLACGRKTMSADMQDAAYCFGCDQLLHILGDKKEEAQPVLLGTVTANPALQVRAVPSFAEAEVLECPPEKAFLDTIRQQQSEAQHFFTTYYLKEDETRANFPILYTLPPERIEALKAERIGLEPARREAELEWLRRLPKLDLHCHLGGVLSPAEMIEVARCCEPDLADAARSNPDFAAWRGALQSPSETPAGGWKQWLIAQAAQMRVHKSLVAAALLSNCRPEELERRIYGQYLNESAFCGIGLNAYEKLGDLQGSALLGNETALRETVRTLLRRCKAENQFYLELRCSPLNYASETFPAKAVIRAVLEELDREADTVQSSILLIATRHGKKREVKRRIADSLQLVRDMEDDPLFAARFRGFDLAGNEREISPEELRPSFLDIMEDCRNITIHAGETEEAESIWEAVYHLNAERIGHGLTLRERPDLMDKFLERGIGIEMCPSSNFQIEGFGDNFLPETANLKPYPLKQYLEKELKVCVNTDDPGISRTTITNELHRAARLTPGGLSKWEILQLLCNGFHSAFFPYARKKRLIRRVERALGELIKENRR